MIKFNEFARKYFRIYENFWRIAFSMRTNFGILIVNATMPADFGKGHLSKRTRILAKKVDQDAPFVAIRSSATAEDFT